MAVKPLWSFNVYEMWFMARLGKDEDPVKKGFSISSHLQYVRWTQAVTLLRKFDENLG